MYIRITQATQSLQDQRKLGMEYTTEVLGIDPALKRRAPYLLLIYVGEGCMRGQ